MRVIHRIESPPIVGYLHHAFPLSVLFGKGECLPWFYSNYAQLACPAGYDFKALITGRREKFDFYVHPGSRDLLTPLLESFWFDRSIEMSDGGLISFLLRSLDSGYCIQACVDEFYVPGMACYQKQHRTHEILVSGYDLETESFVVSIGFDREGDYTVDEISFEEVERAIGSADLAGHYNQQGLGLMRPTKRVEYDLDVAWVVEQLEDYLRSRNSSKRFRVLATPDDRLYGLATYGWLKRYFEHLIDHHDCYDIRPIHILWEHKKVMADRARYLASRGLIDDAFPVELDRLASDVAVMRMMMLKARTTKDTTLIERIGSRLDSVCEEEIPVLERLVTALNPRSRCQTAIGRESAMGLSLRKLA